MTMAMVFALLVGWLGGYVVLRWTSDVARERGDGRTAADAWAVAVPRLLSWGCFLALAVGGLWRLAVAVTR